METSQTYINTTIKYVVNDVLSGKNKTNNLPRILADIKKYLYLEGPLFFTGKKLLTVTGDGKKQGEYSLEVYKVKNSNQHVFIEYFGDLESTNFNNEFKAIASPIQPNKWHHLVISLIPKNKHFKKIIEEILKKYNPTF